MNNEEVKTKEALKVLGINTLNEVTAKDLYYAHMGLSKKYDPSTCTESKYLDGEYLKKVNEAYDYLTADICRTNEVIRNICNPAHKTYNYLPNNNNIEIPNEETINNNYNESKKEEIIIEDKVNIMHITFAVLFPLYGILNYFIMRKMTPKAAKYYLIIGIIGMILNIILLLI